jgi:hypothetical protein
MDTIDRTGTNSDYKMEPSLHDVDLQGGYYGNLELGNLENDSQPQLATPTPCDIAGYRGAIGHSGTQAMDEGTGLLTLPPKSAEHSFIALPDIFDRKRENYRRFCQQFGLFLMAN